MRKVFVALFACIASLASFGQTDSTSAATGATGASGLTIEYPYDVNKFDLSYFPAVTLGAGLSVGSRPNNPAEMLATVRAGYRLKNKGWLQAQYDFYPTNRFDYQYEHLQWDSRLRTTNDFFIYSQLEIGVGYFLTDSTYTPHVVYAVGADDSLDIDPFVEYLEPKRAVYAARTGLTSYQTVVNSRYLNADSLIDDQGTVLGVAGPGSIHTPVADLFHTNIRLINVYVGIERRRITNYERDRDERVVKVKRMLKYYGDVFFSPVFQINPMYVRNTETGYVSRHIVDHTNGGGFERNRLGFRAGATYLVYFRNRHALDFNLELGMRPGLKNQTPGDAMLGGRMYAQGSIIYQFGIEND